MRPSTTALFGAIIVTGGWVALPAVGLAGEAMVTASTRPEGGSAGTAAASPPPQGAASCPEAPHRHAASCTCARCAAIRDE